MVGQLDRNYDRLTPRERLRLVMDALAREDLPEASRLRHACPRKVYKTYDSAFDTPHDAIQLFALMIGLRLTDLTARVEQWRATSWVVLPVLAEAAAEMGSPLLDELEAFPPDGGMPPALEDPAEYDRAARKQANPSLGAALSKPRPRSSIRTSISSPTSTTSTVTCR